MCSLSLSECKSLCERRKSKQERALTYKQERVLTYKQERALTYKQERALTYKQERLDYVFTQTCFPLYIPICTSLKTKLRFNFCIQGLRQQTLLFEVVGVCRLSQLSYAQTHDQNICQIKDVQRMLCLRFDPTVFVVFKRINVCVVCRTLPRV